MRDGVASSTGMSVLSPLRVRTCSRSRHHARRRSSPPGGPCRPQAGVNPDIAAVGLDGGAQDAGVFGQVALRQCRHHAARAGAGNGQPDFVADRNASCRSSRSRRTAPARRPPDVGAEAPRLEAARRVGRAQGVNRRRGQQVQEWRGQKRCFPACSRRSRRRSVAGRARRRVRPVLIQVRLGRRLCRRK